MHREDNLSRLEVLVAALIVSPFDEMAARRCSQIKAELEEQGELLDDLDLQIASIALVYALPLATNNTKHFRRIKDLKIGSKMLNNGASRDLICVIKVPAIKVSNTDTG